MPPAPHLPSELEIDFFGSKVPLLPASSTENSGAVTSLDPRLRSRSSRSCQPNKPSAAQSNTTEDERSNSSFTSAQTEQNTSRGEKRHRDDSVESAHNPAAKFGKTTRSLPAAQKNPASVAKRNARERRRIKNVNLAFDELRQHVPSGENKKKISKVDTLQSAIEYIKALESLVKQKRKMEGKNTTEEDVGESNEEEEREEDEITDLGQESCGTSDSLHGDVVCVQDTEEMQMASCHEQNRPTEDVSGSFMGELRPMLDEFDVVVKNCAQRNQKMQVKPQQNIADFSTYIDFDDSGFSDDSASTHCDPSVQSCANYSPNDHVQSSISDQASVSYTPVYSQEIGFQAKEAFNCEIPNLHATFNGVNPDEVQTLLSPTTTYTNQPVFCPPPPDLYYSHGTSDPHSHCPVPNETQVFGPPHSSAPFTSTPLTELNAKDSGSIFVFPPNANGWGYNAQPHSGMGPTPNNELCFDMSNSSFDGYRFGDTYS